KATSIADLAAVLLEQDEMGRKTKVKREDELGADRKDEVKEMLQLAEAHEKEGLGELSRELEGVRARLENKQPDPEGMSKGMLRREFKRLTARIARIQFAADAVADVQGTPRAQRTVQAEAVAGEVVESPDTLTSSATSAPPHSEEAVATSEPTSSSTEQSSEPTTPSPTTTIRTNEEWSALLPRFPPLSANDLPKLSPLRAKLRRLSSPIFSTEGVKVVWKDLLDAEFAGAWPGGVVHERMVGSEYSAARGGPVEKKDGRPKWSPPSPSDPKKRKEFVEKVKERILKEIKKSGSVLRAPKPVDVEGSVQGGGEAEERV
ncbi:hypothetical protein B0A55_13268, partial [Friedmanniomyces simplex]